MKLLLISNSTNAGEAYLDYPKMHIRDFLGTQPVKALFVPYAAVTFSFDEYESRVENRFAETGHHVVGIHHAADAVKAVEHAEAIVVGGGNTWRLVQMLHQNRLMDAIRTKVLSGTPYIGWSAGSNVACPTLRTTNDMPVVQPESFDTLNLVPFQINPHYTDAHPAGHGGETREDRIREFIAINPDLYVVGLREATMLRYENGKLSLTGDRKARIFKKGCEPQELGAADDFSFLMQ
ncbi:MAG: dipeptidase PepE [Bacteroidales bacterium]|jgi:dipeptidase E|nr:dipeptidase PepE [Bacteroidales bacterium]